MTKSKFRALFLCAVAGAIAFRIARLDLRPMHHDEANQALKFGQLLEHGDYRYDPQDHHGPSLYYLTLPAARLANERTLAGLKETTLRLVPALIGVGIILLLPLFIGGLPRPAVLAAAALAAVSPVMTYYSRFYIQETLLVFFLAGLVAAGWKYLRTRSGWWALAAGLCTGMMFASKETSLILFGALAAALGVVHLIGTFEQGRWAGYGIAGLGGKDERVSIQATGRSLAFHGLIFLAAAATVVISFYTSFFSHPAGLVDSVRAIGTYIGRAGEAGVHSHAWSYYIGMLGYSRFSHGPVWSEGLVLILAIVGGLAAFRSGRAGDGQPRFPHLVLFFTLISTAVYSAIPYKTPWNTLPFYWGILILAGNGAGFLLGLKFSRLRLVRAGVAVLLAAGFIHLAWQGYRANFKDHSNPDNPYVYAQTSPDLLKLVEEVERAAAASPDGAGMLIKVVAPPDETWPLPWYLRRFTRVGYWTEIGEAGRLGDAAVVIASAAFADEIGDRLGEGFGLSYYGLRPEVLLCLFVRRPLTVPAVPF